MPGPRARRRRLAMPAAVARRRLDPCIAAARHVLLKRTGLGTRRGGTTTSHTTIPQDKNQGPVISGPLGYGYGLRARRRM
jgi:hypothetical protein